MGPEITRSSIEEAAARIEPLVRRTPVLALGRALDDRFSMTLKLDSMQPTGSFKVRGAFSLMTAATVPPSGVVAASGGNFGLAVAHAARVLGHRATIFVPGTSPPEKVDRIASYGAGVTVVPGYYPDALEMSREWAAGVGALEAHAYDQAEVVAGQGTLGPEIMEQVPDVDSILVAVGGGGLIAGIASWARGRARVVGVEPEACPTLNRAVAAGGPVPVEIGGVAASSLGASVLGDHAWEAIRWVHRSVLVTDADIVEAQRWLWETCRVMAEPAGAAPVAALLAGVYTPKVGEHVVAVVSGANTGGLAPQA
jgi:threonine dehydratase